MIYNEKITRLREDQQLEANPYKMYVTVYAKFTGEGEMIPFSLELPDGRRLSIDRITDRRRAASRKAGGCGIRYVCMIENKRIELYYEENYRWFVAASPS